MSSPGQKKDKEEKLTTIQQKKQKRCNEERKEDKKVREEDRKVLQVGAEPITINKGQKHAIALWDVKLEMWPILHSLTST